MQNHTVELGHTAAYYYLGKDVALAFGTGVPFGLNAREEWELWLLHGGGTELMQDVFTNFNCYGLPMGNTGSQMEEDGFESKLDKVRTSEESNSVSQDLVGRSSVDLE